MPGLPELEVRGKGVAEIIARCIRDRLQGEIIFSMFLYSKYLQNMER
ncbi:MAG: hypothetical protein Ct9H300mP28_15930 [Pseudomonadota bacterium]|nr:MAG: hypothetical protein Ct9H300mP28_15930 [Pseudomonadota bacterium]